MAKSPEITLAQNFQNLVNKLKAISKHTSLSTKGLEKLAKMLVTSGNHTSTWQPYNTGSGVYFIQLSNGNTAQTEKVIYLK